MRGERFLLTGAGGVIGGAVLEALGERPVTCLLHRRQLLDTPRHRAVTGDLRLRRLGLAPSDYRQLAREVGCVIHCAGQSRYDTTAEALRSANVTAVDHVAQFTKDADAPLVHVSTALLATKAASPPREHGAGPFGLHEYLRSKRAAEELLAEHETPVVIVRPSFVLGDSTDGYTPRFQLLHTILRLLLEGAVPVLPVPAEARVDYLPRELVGACIAEIAVTAAVDRQQGEAWLTAGPVALLAEELLELVGDFARKNGYGGVPRRVEPDVVERLVIPAILPALPPRAATRLRRLIGMIEPLTVLDDLPCSLPAALDNVDGALLRRTLERSLAYWHVRSVRRSGVEAVAT